MGFPTKKQLKVNNSKLSESDDKGVSGREFRMPSIHIMNVKNSSKVILAFPTTFLKWYLKDLTCIFHRPPKTGTLGGTNFYLMPFEANKFETSSFFSTKICKRFNSAETLTTFVALSLNTC